MLKTISAIFGIDRFKAALSALLLVFALPVAALDPDTLPSQYRMASWDRSGGLPNTVVHAITQTADGYLWLGTEEGLVRFDGTEFQLYDSGNTKAFRSNTVRSLCAASDGSLWIGSSDGAYRYAKGEFTRIETAQGERYRDVYSLLCRKDGSAVAGTRHGGLFVLSAKGATPYPGWPSLPGHNVPTALLTDSDGTLWVGTFGDGLLACRKLSCTNFVSEGINASARITALAARASGQILAAVYYQGIHEISAGRSHLIYGEQIGPGVVWNIKEDANRNLWIANRDGGLYRMNSADIARITTLHTQFPLYPHALFEDSERNLWIGSEGSGLHRISDVFARTYSVDEGLSPKNIAAVYADSDGVVWTGTRSGGVNRISKEGVQVWNDMPSALADIVTGIARSRGDRLWFATRDGIYSSDGRSKPQIDLRPGAPSGLVTGFFADSTGRLWAGGEPNGLTVSEGKLWRPLGVKQGFDGGSARFFAESSDGSVLIGTQARGVYRYQDNRFSRYSFTGKEIDPEVRSIYVDSTGAVWVALRDKGLYLLRDGKFMPVGAQSGLPAQVYSMMEDSKGGLWFCTSAGILGVTRAALFAPSIVQGKLRALDEVDGVYSPQCSEDGQPLIARDTQGVLWFAMTTGLVRIDPQKSIARPKAPAVAIQKIIMGNGREIGLAQMHDIVLNPGAKRMQVYFDSISLSQPERLRFRYRLNGNERWVEIGNTRVLQLVSLSPGKNRLSLQASYGDANWGAETGFEFYIPLPFRKTIWAYLLVAGALVLLGYFIYRYKMNIMRVQARELQERNRIARELHDTIAQVNSGILIRLEVARRLAPENADALRENLSALDVLVRDSLSQVRSAATRMRPEEYLGLDMCEALRMQAERQLHGTGVSLRFHGVGKPLLVEPVALHHLGRILEESISNAIQHARAQEIEVKVRVQKADTVLEITDTGPGSEFPTLDRLASGGGIRGMQERMSEIGGTLRLEVSESGGLRVLAILPLALLKKRKA